MSRAEATGDQRHTASKLAARYSAEAEAECIGWFQALTGATIPAGMRNVEKALRDGQTLMKLAIAVQGGTANTPPAAKKMKLKVNTQNAPFKQMENITNFVKFCENFGMDKAGTFQTVDLYEGRNMAQVINCIQQLGTEAQRHGFNGPTIGAKPVEKNVREFTDEQMRAGNAIIGLQAGTNKCASQSGMSMGGVRHVADIKADDMDKAGQSIISGQMGYNKGASQAGMGTGQLRSAGDSQMCAEGQSVIGLQMGSNKGASQSGMSMGGARHAADIRADDMDKAGAGIIGGQAGYNKGASQAGMGTGQLRQAGDSEMCADGQSFIGGQAGYNKGASQAGMGHGQQRYAGDNQMSADGQSVIGLQMGSNKGASQSGMSFGGARHAGDIDGGQMSADSQGVINLQAGSNKGASQAGMAYGNQRL